MQLSSMTLFSSVLTIILRPVIYKALGRRALEHVAVNWNQIRGEELKLIMESIDLQTKDKETRARLSMALFPRAGL
jgi:hypothetical protein